MGQIGSVYKQPGKREDDYRHSWRAPSKWKRGTKGSREEKQQGEQGEVKKGQKNHAMYICKCSVVQRIIECRIMLSRVHMIITGMNAVLYIIISE